MSKTEKRMAWSGTCNECMAVVILFASNETDPAEQELTSSEWPEAGDCYVQDCEGSMDWNGNDPIGQVVQARLI